MSPSIDRAKAPQLYRVFFTVCYLTLKHGGGENIALLADSLDQAAGNCYLRMIKLRKRGLIEISHCGRGKRARYRATASAIQMFDVRHSP